MLKDSRADKVTGECRMSGLPMIRQQPKRGILSVNISTSALAIMRASTGVPVDIGVYEYLFRNLKATDFRRLHGIHLQITSFAF
jgi:hypothetical protein